MRVFPLSNWTEHDVWEYIAVEGIDVVPLYFAAVRPTVGRGSVWIEVDDERLLLKYCERPEMRRVRYPHSGMLSADGSDRVGGGNALPKSSPNCAPRAGRSDKAG